MEQKKSPPKFLTRWCWGWPSHPIRVQFSWGRSSDCKNHRVPGFRGEQILLTCDLESEDLKVKGCFFWWTSNTFLASDSYITPSDPNRTQSLSRYRMTLPSFWLGTGIPGWAGAVVLTSHPGEHLLPRSPKEFLKWFLKNKVSGSHYASMGLVYTPPN